MSVFSDLKIEEYREAFQLFDTVGDGKIECSESGDVIRSLDFNPASEEIKKVVIDIDPKGIKRITFEEFLPILHAVAQKCPKKPKPEEFFEGLKVFDKDGYGVVLSGELRQVLTSLGDKLTDDECDVLFREVEDKKGRINIEEFVKMVLSG
ncbi:myosin-2 essential light chain-like [Paramuricea clavata]|uniref:Myosin-2 essential light chain-like n=1 Tax=Paramuricea clavata TaxID=317549 RepID=A0A6S7HGG7_PARCT|nr:myosin-2 essential light chain-like [Paramuricea clavata]